MLNLAFESSKKSFEKCNTFHMKWPNLYLFCWSKEHVIQFDMSQGVSLQDRHYDSKHACTLTDWKANFMKSECLHQKSIHIQQPPLKNLSSQLASLVKANCMLAEIITEN
jgi:hypothetical protein